MYKQVILFLTAIMFMSCHAIAQEKLRFSIDLIRHGDRTPIIWLSKDPYIEAAGSGELTAKGMQQEFKLGAQLRKQYINHYHLLPEHYTDKTIYVRSSDFNRTLMSAQAFLLGLYPLGTGPSAKILGGYQPVPIHTVSQEQDDLLVNDKVLPGHNFLTAVANYFQQATLQQTNLKAVFFFGHDSTIKRVMIALQAPLNEEPPYTSDLNFSLIENNKHYFVKIQLNGKQVIIPACKEASCSLQTFLQFIKNQTLTSGPY